MSRKFTIKAKYIGKPLSFSATAKNRFNIPFEFGLAAAIGLNDDQHQWRVLECVPHRVAQCGPSARP